MSDHYTELTTHLPSHNIYGLPSFELSSLRSNFIYEKQVSYTRNKVNIGSALDGNLYYMCMEDTGIAHGVVMETPYPAQVTLQPGPSLTFKTVGGNLVFYIFPGPEPYSVIDQLTTHYGKPPMPPYWSMGVHLCREGVDYESVRRTFRDMELTGLPYESDCIDSNISSSVAFTVDQTKYPKPMLNFLLMDFVKAGKKLTLAQFPQIATLNESNYHPYDEKEDSEFIQYNDSLYRGIYNWRDVIYPDYTNPKLFKWLKDQYTYLVEDEWGLNEHQKEFFDGVFLLDNTPLNHDTEMEGLNTTIEFPEDFGEEPLSFSTNTVFQEAEMMDGIKHYENHNIYGHSQLKMTNEIFTEFIPKKKRFLLTSESTAVGSSQYGGFFGGNFSADYSSMRMALFDTLRRGVAGSPFVGYPICGNSDAKYFETDPTFVEFEDLCIKWLQVAAYSPWVFSHYLSNNRPRNPSDLSKTFRNAASVYLGQRMRLLPYLYNLNLEAHLHGKPITRAMFLEFPEEELTYDLDHQFMLGPALMIAPVLYKTLLNMKTYFPAGCWYEYYSGKFTHYRFQWFHNLFYNVTRLVLDEVAVKDGNGQHYIV